MNTGLTGVHPKGDPIPGWGDTKYTQGLTKENMIACLGATTKPVWRTMEGESLSASKMMRQPLQGKQWGHVTQKLHTGRAGSQLSHKSMQNGQTENITMAEMLNNTQRKEILKFNLLWLVYNAC